MKTLIYSLAMGIFLPSIGFSAAPDDISTDQRAWFDAVDINADNNYNDNPINNSPIDTWWDKSGSGNHVSASGNIRPLYRHNTLSASRHGVDFDGLNDKLTDNDDIWINSVDTAESLILATTDVVTNSSLFSSTDNHRNRLSTHLPWGSNLSFYDHGFCCSPPARMYGNVPITLSRGYIWHFIGEPTYQAVVRDGETLLSDGGAGV